MTASSSGKRLPPAILEDNLVEVTSPHGAKISYGVPKGDDRVGTYLVASRERVLVMAVQVQRAQ